MVNNVWLVLWLSRNAVPFDVIASGDLDAEAFGKGYGEENDWCLRATKAGFVNLLAEDVFVHHAGQIQNLQVGQADEHAVKKIKQVVGRLQPRQPRHLLDTPLGGSRRKQEYGIDAGGACEEDPLHACDRSDIEDHVVDRLEQGTGSHLMREHETLREGFGHPAHPIEIGRRCSDNRGQRTLLGFKYAARHRCVDILDAAGSHGLVDVDQLFEALADPVATPRAVLEHQECRVVGERPPELPPGRFADRGARRPRRSLISA